MINHFIQMEIQSVIFYGNEKYKNEKCIVQIVFFVMLFTLHL